MVTSALPREGKSTTLGNLGVALARAGRRVVIVDLDLRRPFLNRFFHVRSVPGITDVALGRVELDEALCSIALAPSTKNLPSTNHKNGSHQNGRSQVAGVLSLLPAGTIPLAPGEFVDTDEVGVVLEELARRYDFVLIDAPPLLAVGDATTLSAKVDAIFAVVRLKVIHRASLQELARQLSNCRAETLGFVLTGAELGEGYGYGYAYGYTAAEARRGEQPVA